MSRLKPGQIVDLYGGTPPGAFIAAAIPCRVYMRGSFNPTVSAGVSFAQADYVISALPDDVWNHSGAYYALWRDSTGADHAAHILGVYATTSGERLEVLAQESTQTPPDGWSPGVVPPPPGPPPEAIAVAFVSQIDNATKTDGSRPGEYPRTGVTISEWFDANATSYPPDQSGLIPTGVPWAGGGQNPVNEAVWWEGRFGNVTTGPDREKMEDSQGSWRDTSAVVHSGALPANVRWIGGG